MSLSGYSPGEPRWESCLWAAAVIAFEQVERETRIFRYVPGAAAIVFDLFREPGEAALEAVYALGGNPALITLAIDRARHLRDEPPR